MAQSCFNEAAALCRGKLKREIELIEQGREASMRPRRYAADNMVESGGKEVDLRRFNEAAALCRG